MLNIKYDISSAQNLFESKVAFWHVFTKEGRGEEEREEREKKKRRRRRKRKRRRRRNNKI
jgi:hypothetical protein